MSDQPDMNPDIWDELDILASAWLDGCLNDQESERLQLILKMGPEYRRHYLNLVHLDTMAAQMLQTEQLITPPLIPVDKILKFQKHRTIRLALLSTAALLLVLLTIGLFIKSDDGTEILAFKVTEGSKYALVHSKADSIDTPKGKLMAKGSRLTLSQGSVELTLKSGVRSVIMAPADLTLLDENTLTLDEGTAWFQVPEEAIGFNVKTKDLDIVDLGTEFGILAKPNDNDEIHVIKGKVLAKANYSHKESATLTGGEARRIDSIGRLTEIPVKPSAFLSELPKVLPYLYWSFDELSDDKLLTQGTHPEVIDLVSTLKSPGNGATLVSGKFGKALSLDGKASFMETNWPGFKGDQPRTISFWFKLPENSIHNQPSSILGWGDNSTALSRWDVILMPASAANGNQAELDIRRGPNTAIRTTSPKPGQWHHIAISYSGAQNPQGLYMEQVYINGNRIDTGQITLVGPKSNHRKLIDTSLSGKDNRMFNIGTTLNIGIVKYYHQGLIDELYIIQGHLSEEEIQQIMLGHSDYKPSSDK